MNSNEQYLINVACRKDKLPEAAMDIIKATVESAGKISPAIVRQYGELLQHGATAATDAPAMPRLLSRKDVAKIMGKTPRCIDNYVAWGWLECFKGPGGIRSRGITEDSVRKLIADYSTRARPGL